GGAARRAEAVARAPGVRRDGAPRRAEAPRGRLAGGVVDRQRVRRRPPGVAPGVSPSRRDVRQLDGTGLKRLHRAWRQRTGAQRLALVLDGLGTPANVGAIVRTAAAYRVERLWLAGATPPLEAAGVQRTALGT